MKRADIVIVGSGVAALQIARKLRSDLNVIIITKGKWEDSNSYRAQGGIAAVVSPIDNVDLHVKDTIQAGENHNNLSSTKWIVKNSTSQLDSLIQEGFEVDRKMDGSIDLGLEGAHSTNRIIHSGGDATGVNLCEFMYKDTNVTWMEHSTVRKILLDNQRKVSGLVYVDENNQIGTITTSHLILATGGGGSIYKHSSNQQGALGDGYYLAHEAGAVLVDMEFVQFHPTLLQVKNHAVGLLTEALRGAGATLVTKNGLRIMQDVHSGGELAPRHIVAHTIYQHIRAGSSIYLDCRRIKNLKKKFPSLWNLSQLNNLDPTQDLLPVIPGSHFFMGGIEVDYKGETAVEGLYAIGEVSCTGLHGANRLASNSLLEGIVQGNALADYLNNSRILSPSADLSLEISSLDDGDKITVSKETIQDLTMSHIGIIRNKEDLEWFYNWVQEQLSMYRDVNPITCTASDFEKIIMLHTALFVARGANLRKESRGAHVYANYPNATPAWEKLDILQSNIDVKIRGRKHEQIVR
ncbi:L-aspartate oxidase [Mangrovibacillus cuniculi]|uniref:L-aspartate oxidase n=1 Tax=Mangrovibacillus cuniculi TaxID=2593652 RepID=A0A7S8HFN9_9BACI|nr:FAD-binding protein [Mangrovibacillus cuniculi]QPC47033.1 FAD-binding protein [Mangrovibacillus cuniculi]